MRPHAGSSPTPTPAGPGGVPDPLGPWRRLAVGTGWPWALVWLLSRGWMLHTWAHAQRYIANDVNYYFGQLAGDSYATVLREYPLPVVWLLDLLRLPVDGDGSLYLAVFALAMAALDAGFSLWLWHRHSRVAALYWMAYVFAMGPLVWFRYDLLAGVVVGAAAFLVARRPTVSGALVALGAGLKLWPALLVTALVGRTSRGRARLAAFGATGVALALASLLVAGPVRLVSPLTWQSERGLQIESVWASLPMWRFHHGAADALAGGYSVEMSPFNAYEVFGPGVGQLLHAASLVMALGVLFSLVVALLAWRRGSVRPDVRALAMVAVVVFMLVGNKTLSPQYMAWFGAVVAAWLGLAPRGAARVRAGAVGLAALVLAWMTSYVYPAHYGDLLRPGVGPSRAVWALVLRNLGLLALLPLLCWWTVRELAASRRFAPVDERTDSIGSR